MWDSNGDRIPPIHNYLIDLSSLSKAETDILHAVLAKDDMAMRPVDEQVGILRKEIEKIRGWQKPKPNDKKAGEFKRKCCRCQKPLPLWKSVVPFVDSGKWCMRCHLKACKKCRVKQGNGKFFCSMCVRYREEKWLTGEWAQKSCVGLIGSDLLRASLRNKKAPAKKKESVQEVAPVVAAAAAAPETDKPASGGKKSKKTHRRRVTKHKLSTKKSKKGKGGKSGKGKGGKGKGGKGKGKGGKGKGGKGKGGKDKGGKDKAGKGGKKKGGKKNKSKNANENEGNQNVSSQKNRESGEEVEPDEGEEESEEDTEESEEDTTEESEEDTEESEEDTEDEEEVDVQEMKYESTSDEEESADVALEQLERLVAEPRLLQHVIKSLSRDDHLTSHVTPFVACRNDDQYNNKFRNLRKCCIHDESKSGSSLTSSKTGEEPEGPSVNSVNCVSRNELVKDEEAYRVDTTPASLRRCEEKGPGKVDTILQTESISIAMNKELNTVDVYQAKDACGDALDSAIVTHYSSKHRNRYENAVTCHQKYEFPATKDIIQDDLDILCTQRWRKRRSRSGNCDVILSAKDTNLSLLTRVRGQSYSPTRISKSDKTKVNLETQHQFPSQRLPGPGYERSATGDDSEVCKEQFTEEEMTRYSKNRLSEGNKAAILEHKSMSRKVEAKADALSDSSTSLGQAEWRTKSADRRPRLPIIQEDPSRDHGTKHRKDKTKCSEDSVVKYKPDTRANESKDDKRHHSSKAKHSGDYEVDQGVNVQSGNIREISKKLNREYPTVSTLKHDERKGNKVTSEKNVHDKRRKHISKTADAQKEKYGKRSLSEDISENKDSPKQRGRHRSPNLGHYSDKKKENGQVGDRKKTKQKLLAQSGKKSSSPSTRQVKEPRDRSRSPVDREKKREKRSKSKAKSSNMAACTAETGTLESPNIKESNETKTKSEPSNRNQVLSAQRKDHAGKIMPPKRPFESLKSNRVIKRMKCLFDNLLDVNSSSAQLNQGIDKEGNINENFQVIRGQLDNLGARPSSANPAASDVGTRRKESRGERREELAALERRLKHRKPGHRSRDGEIERDKEKERGERSREREVRKHHHKSKSKAGIDLAAVVQEMAAKQNQPTVMSAVSKPGTPAAEPVALPPIQVVVEKPPIRTDSKGSQTVKKRRGRISGFLCPFCKLTCEYGREF